jgi:peroxiredoxin
MNKLLLLTLFILAGLISACKPEKKNEAPMLSVANDLPAMSITKLDGTSVNAKTLTGKTILILFFPDCDHCQREAKAIQEHIQSFKEYNLYFISTVSAPEISKFSADYNLSGEDNVHFATTTVQQVLDNFGPVDAPSIYIYTAEGKRAKSFNGEVAIEEVLKSL